MRFSLFPKSYSKEEIERDAARQIEEVISAGRPPPAEWSPGQGTDAAPDGAAAPAATAAASAPAMAAPPPPPPPAPMAEQPVVEGPGPVVATSEPAPDAATWDPIVEPAPAVEAERSESGRARSNGARRRPAEAGRPSS